MAVKVRCTQTFAHVVYVLYKTYISQIEGDLQIAPEVIGELWIHVQYLQNILSVDLVQVTVGKSSDVSVGLAWSGIQINGLTEYIILSCRKHQ